MYKKHNNLGFSLVEMAIVMCVIAVVAGAALVMSNAQQEKNKYEVTKERIDVIVAALKQQGEAGGFLLCPASLSVLETSTSFGVATDCSAAVVAGVMELGASPDAVRVGAVPVRSLNLPNNTAYDGWGNRFTYMVVKNLALNSSTALSDYVTSSTNNVIQVLDAGGNQSMPATTNDVTSFVVISHGKDGIGATNRKGVVVTACDATTKDGENCDGDVVLRDMRVMDSSTAANYYFDVVRWVPLYLFQ
jgi:prepilin-type N-terminal cleavage/methylation domain-containing protein